MGKKTAELNPSDLEALTERELIELDGLLDRLISACEIQNLRGNVAIFHDDQHIGEKRRELNALDHPSVDVGALMAFRDKPVVDSLEGNMLVHPLTTPVIVVDESNTRSRATWWSLGIEGLSKFREKPQAILSAGMVPGVQIVERGGWKVLWGEWQRTTKNDYHEGFVRSMVSTNTRPPLTPEQDRAFLGRYAYQKDEVRHALPHPPKDDTWERWPDECDKAWFE